MPGALGKLSHITHNPSRAVLLGDYGENNREMLISKKNAKHLKDMIPAEEPENNGGGEIKLKEDTW